MSDPSKCVIDEKPELPDAAMLVLALFACGIDDIHYFPDGSIRYPFDPIKGLTEAWDPFERNDDCFALMVMLSIGIKITRPFSTSATIRGVFVGIYESHKYHGCPYKATRRAVVRQAAHEGKLMMMKAHSPFNLPNVSANSEIVYVERKE